MSETTHIHVRDARDRLLDLLNIGQTYPLRDLKVRDDQLTVAYGTPARIPIADSQKGVLYRLRDSNKDLVRREDGTLIEEEGTGGEIRLETYNIKVDVTFTILAEKLLSGRQAQLNETATVKVGLDVSLKAWIKDTPHLDPAMTDPTNSSPRIIDYGKSINVELPSSQEGVEYSLVSVTNEKETVLSEGGTGKTGTGGDIDLISKSVQEDTDIRIRALNTFDSSEDREPQTALLDIVLPLRVRANPELKVRTAATVLDYTGSGTVVLVATQQSVRYRLFMHAIPDRDYVHLNRSDWAKVEVELEDGTTVQVRDLVPQGEWNNPEDDGFKSVGKAMRGNGGEISFPVKGLTEDTLFLIQAKKEHRFLSDRDPIPSTIRLQQAAVILVRPNPSPALHILTTAQEDASSLLEVSQGQPGVFYHFRPQPDGLDLALPAYMHQKNGAFNKGIADRAGAAANDGLAVGVDFVTARSLPAGTDAGDPATRDPLPPQLLLPPDTAPPTELHVYAVKAQTGVGAALADSVTLPTLPKIEPEKPVVAKGASSKIRVYASKGDERYRLLHHGEPVVVDGAPADGWYKGTGQNRLLPTGPIMETTTFQVVIRRQNDSVTVDRSLTVRVRVTS